jgi:hypothetical protein
MFKSLGYYILALFFLSFVQQAHAQTKQQQPPPNSSIPPVEAKCKEPSSDSVIAFNARKCAGKPGDQFNADEALGGTVWQGMTACRDLEGQWRTYCSCLNQPLVSSHAADSQELSFMILGCRDKPNMQVYCGTFACGTKQLPLPKPAEIREGE